MIRFVLKLAVFIIIISCTSLKVFCSESIKSPLKFNLIEPTALEIIVPENKDFEITAGVNNTVKSRSSLLLGFDAGLSNQTTLEFDLSQSFQWDSLLFCETRLNYNIVNDPVHQLILNSGVEMEINTRKGLTIAPEAVLSFIKGYKYLMLTGEIRAGAEFGLGGNLNNEIDPELGVSFGPYFHSGFFQIGVPLTASFENEKLHLLLQSEIDLRITHGLVGVFTGGAPFSPNFSRSGPFRFYTGFKADL